MRNPSQWTRKKKLLGGLWAAGKRQKEQGTAAWNKLPFCRRKPVFRIKSIESNWMSPVSKNSPCCSDFCITLRHDWPHFFSSLICTSWRWCYMDFKLVNKKKGEWFKDHEAENKLLLWLFISQVIAFKFIKSTVSQILLMDLFRMCSLPTV